MIAEVLKHARDIPLLNTGIDDNRVQNSPYPTKEHRLLLSHSGKPVSTPLNIALASKALQIPTSKHDANYKDRARLERYKANAQKLSFRGSRESQIPKIKWEEYQLTIEPMIIEHVKILLSNGKNLTNTMSKLFRASSDFIGDASLTIEQQSSFKAKSLCLPIIAEHPWAPSDDEETDIQNIVLEELRIAARPNPRTDPEEHRKFENLKV